jgi:hyperosmotically inducible periplasmic protein
MNSLKFSLQVCALVVLCGSGLGLVSLQSGCAATPTKESTGEFVDDSTITAKVKAAFIHDEVVKAFDVSVETFKGTVQLSGFVDTAAQRSRAVQLARGIKGVRDVENKITVK